MKCRKAKASALSSSWGEVLILNRKEWAAPAGPEGSGESEDSIFF